MHQVGFDIGERTVTGNITSEKRKKQGDQGESAAQRAGCCLGLDVSLNRVYTVTQQEGSEDD
jgi:hypothetical protein